MTSKEMLKEIKNEMTLQGFTNKSLAESLNRHPSTITRWLNSPKTIRINKIFLLCGVLGLKVTLEVTEK